MKRCTRHARDVRLIIDVAISGAAMLRHMTYAEAVPAG
jgi:hypothetical protein